MSPYFTDAENRSRLPERAAETMFPTRGIFSMRSVGEASKLSQPFAAEYPQPY
jgi:hypothetical protein